MIGACLRSELEVARDQKYQYFRLFSRHPKIVCASALVRALFCISQRLVGHILEAISIIFEHR
jgi:hypothetical protein